MAEHSLERFIKGVASAWGPLSSELVAACRQHLEELLSAPASEDWLAALLCQAPASHELHRDRTKGFVLLAHSEPEGLYRPPHDHGRGWVMYGMVRGASEMGSYYRIKDEDGRVTLVKRHATLVRAGQVQVYLPGDIHDTLCSSGPALLLRFTERDLQTEDQEEHRVTRYHDQDGRWVPRQG